MSVGSVLTLTAMIVVPLRQNSSPLPTHRGSTPPSLEICTFIPPAGNGWT